MVAHAVMQTLGDFGTDHGFKDIRKFAPLGHLQCLAIAVMEVTKIIEVGGQHREAAMRVTQREWNGPGYGGIFGQLQCAVPAHVIGGTADAKNRIQHQLHRAGTSADHQVGAGHRLREAIAHFMAHALNAKQHGAGQSDGQQHQAQRVAAVPGALGG